MQDDKKNWGGDREGEKRSKKPILYQVCVAYKTDQEIKCKACWVGTASFMPNQNESWQKR